MVNETSIYKKVVTIPDNSGEMKVQVTIDLTPWDSSKMESYKEGSPVLKGHSCCIRTLKPNKKFPKARVDIDPSNKELRQALSEMYLAYDKVKK